MTAVRMRGEHLNEVRRLANAAYPEECCGFLLARDGGSSRGPRTIEAVEPAANEVEGERRRRFVISPLELRAAEERAEKAGLVVCGFYHSHPDHPARPSEFDQSHAWPWYTYVVVSVDSTGKGEVGAFELNAERREFERVPLEAPSVGGPAPGRAARQARLDSGEGVVS